MYYIILCYITFDISYFIENCANRAPKSTHYEPNVAPKSSQNGPQNVSKKDPSKGPRLRRPKHCKTAAGSPKMRNPPRLGSS